MVAKVSYLPILLGGGAIAGAVLLSSAKGREQIQNAIQGLIGGKGLGGVSLPQIKLPDFTFPEMTFDLSGIGEGLTGIQTNIDDRLNTLKDNTQNVISDIGGGISYIKEGGVGEVMGKGVITFFKTLGEGAFKIGSDIGTQLSEKYDVGDRSLLSLYSKWKVRKTNWAKDVTPFQFIPIKDMFGGRGTPTQAGTPTSTPKITGGTTLGTGTSYAGGGSSYTAPTSYSSGGSSKKRKISYSIPLVSATPSASYTSPSYTAPPTGQPTPLSVDVTPTGSRIRHAIKKFFTW